MAESSKETIHLILSGDPEEGRSDAIYSQDMQLLRDPESIPQKNLIAYIQILSKQVNTLTKKMHEYQQRISSLEKSRRDFLP